MAKRRPFGKLPPSASEKNEIVRANVNRLTEKSPSFVSLYANDVQVQTSPWDIRLILGEIDTMSAVGVDNPTITVRQVGELRISVQLAKRLTMILVAQLRNYEELVGEIPLPKD